ncbi:rhodanese-like domain-containing protein [Aquirufa ecclesiirivi]|uniref:Rhodanese-like domain-containing protein n=1 Tax=Aquirufa ecclesiirivi TaxID=2715124 RepID=A0ABT4JE17_9BACT|nr:rhodanese-like domain-containing protein [Aquirufa ecclesiirivi]MCZ2472900.1 rhodanese-like domain-containing protein [Aquirufa ecclesiirivi]MCZ2474532.1 rhodanese-like domain-containing protein [Aquirufa ecclesiirivi]MDF0694640.1 rhodanese-like domain-containing protein [Aquirufa ecclesiirivi]NHC49640.1 rhodanese-like domain-containing protein [Aquirufa ecclesiirivi]
MDITVEELKERMDNNEALYIIDVREENEYEEFNIGAQLIPLGELPERLDEIKADKDAEIIVHCRSGARSGRAQQYLSSEGYGNVRNLVGGMLAWQAAGY